MLTLEIHKVVEMINSHLQFYRQSFSILTTLFFFNIQKFTFPLVLCILSCDTVCKIIERARVTSKIIRRTGKRE